MIGDWAFFRSVAEAESLAFNSGIYTWCKFLGYKIYSWLVASLVEDSFSSL
jgi:hypothetical protein